MLERIWTELDLDLGCRIMPTPSLLAEPSRPIAIILGVLLSMLGWRCLANVMSVEDFKPSYVGCDHLEQAQSARMLANSSSAASPDVNQISMYSICTNLFGIRLVGLSDFDKV